MDRSLYASLDDIIESKRSNRRGRVRGVASQRRPVRGSFDSARMGGMRTLRQRNLGVNVRPSAFAIAKSFRRSKNFPLQRDLFEESLAAAGISRNENDSKLFISNLDSGVSNDDIRELFSEVGELKRYAVHFDKNGRPSGSAEVVYARRSDAFAALKRYNNVQLDGRPMKIEISSPTSEAPISARVNVIGGMNGRSARKVTLDQAVGGTRSSAPVNRSAGPRIRGGFQNGQGRFQNGQGRQVPRSQQGSRGGPRGTGQFQSRGRRRGKAQGQGMEKHIEKSATELDQELEKYHAEAMQT